MRIRAAAFALALGIATPAIGAPAISDWSEQELLAAAMELSGALITCEESVELSLDRVNLLMGVANERAKALEISDERTKRNQEVVFAVERARETPATFCWTIVEKYGPEGTVLPGMVRAR